VPVDRFVGIGFVRPRTVLPAAGVCASVSSRPVPPAFVRAFARPRFGGVGFADPLRLDFLVDFAVFALALRFGADAFFLGAAFLPDLRGFDFGAAFFAMTGSLTERP